MAASDGHDGDNPTPTFTSGTEVRLSPQTQFVDDLGLLIDVVHMEGKEALLKFLYFGDTLIT